jgi:tetratricopeptide (TPR) repeat protein
MRQHKTGLSEGWALNNLALAYHHNRDFSRAITVSQEAVEFFRSRNDQRGEAASLNTYGMACRESGLIADAVEASRQTYELFHELDDHQHLSGALGNYAAALESDMHGLQEALAMHQDAVRMAQESGDPRNLAALKNLYGTALLKVARFQEAEIEHRHALDLYRSIGDKHGESMRIAKT